MKFFQKSTNFFLNTKKFSPPKTQKHAPRKKKKQKKPHDLYFFLFATVLALPLRVLAFVFVLCPRTGSCAMCLRPR